MRLWTLHPKYLDPRGLAALWREALLAQAVLRGLTKAYTQHPQLIRFRRSRTPVRCIAEYLRVVYEEGKRRGYKFNSSKITRGGRVESLIVSHGQLRYEWLHFLEKVRLRNPKWFHDLVLVKRVVPHPLFKIIPGGIAEWERISDAAQLPENSGGPIHWERAAQQALEPDGCPALRPVAPRVKRALDRRTRLRGDDDIRNEKSDHRDKD